MGEVWYRYVDVCYAAPVNEDGDVYPGVKGDRKVQLRELQVIRATPKGVWLYDRYGHERFVLRDATKRYACPTKEEAIVSFVARKKRQLGIYEARASDARTFVSLGLKMQDELIPPPERPGCYASRGDGECYWKNCPQLRDNEPAATGRHCPRDQREEEF